MSKKYPQKNKKKPIAQVVEEREQEILQDIIACSSVCGDLGGVAVSKADYTVEEINDLIKELPGVDYVIDRLLNYLFSNGLTTGNETFDQERLDPWLYEQKNRYDATNYEVLRSVIAQATIYGECGLRMFDGNLYQAQKGYYGMLTRKEDGIEEVVAYFIRKDGKMIDRDFRIDEWNKFERWTDPEQYFDDNGMILLDTSEFVNIRNDTTTLHGYSPFTRDRQRLDLLLSVYERLNYDIDYDGPGRIIVRPKDGYINGDNDVSTGQIINNSIQAQEARNERAKAEIRRVANEIKNSTSDSVILLSNAFDKDITHLPRVTKATEFMTWLESDTVVIAQVLGMSPTLLEVGKLHGNVSVEKIIDNAMLNTIIPKREKYAVQFSKLIADHLGVEKVYFDKYDMEQVQDENETRQRVSQIIKDLSTANKQSPSENTARLIEEMDDFLRTSIYNDNETPKTL